MAGLVIPSQWQKQPQYPIGIDWNNPITVGLRAAYSPLSTQNAAKNSESATYYNGFEQTGAELAAIANASYIAMHVGTAGISIPSGGDFTLVYVLPKAALVGSNPGLMRSGAGALTAGTAGTGTTFTIIQGTSFRPWIRLNGSDILKPASGDGLAVGGAYVIAFRVKSSSSAAIAWGGKIRHTASHSTATPAFSFSYIGAQSGTSEYAGSLSGFFVFNRALSDDELRSITLNPWQVYQPIHRFLPLDVVSGGATTHSTTGALTGQGSSVAGTAAHVAKHATSGALSGQGSSVVGAATRFRAHATSGGLTGQGSTVSGSAARSAAGIHATSGALSGQGSSISGTAARSALHATSGALAGPGASVVGVAAHKAIHATSGALTGPGAQVVAIAEHSGAGAVVPNRGGGIGHGKKKRTIIVDVDGVEYRVPETQLGSFLESVRKEDPPAVAKPVKKQKKADPKPVQKPVQVEVKSAPAEILPIVQQQVDQTNEQIRQAWERAVIQREIEEEEETLLWLMAA